MFVIFCSACLSLSANLIIGNMVIVRNVQQPSVASKACLLSSNFAVEVPNSQAYRKWK